MLLESGPPECLHNAVAECVQLPSVSGTVANCVLLKQKDPAQDQTLDAVACDRRGVGSGFRSRLQMNPNGLRVTSAVETVPELDLLNLVELLSDI